MPTSRMTWRGCIAAIILCALAAVSPAQTIVYVDRDATGPTHDGTSWCTAFLDLQPTLLAALPNTEIRVADGRYRPAASARNTSFVLKSGVTIYGGFAGCGAVNPDLRDLTLHETILSGDLFGNDGPNFTNRAENSYAVVRGDGADATALLDGFTISGGNANGTNPLDRGGGIRNYAPTTTATAAVFRNLIIRDNEAAHSRGGGGLYNDHTLSHYINCKFIGNRSAHHGGAIYNSGPAFPYPDGIATSPTFINCTIVSNHAGGSAGGMYNTGTANPTIINSIIWANTHTGTANIGAQIIPLAGVIVRYTHIQSLTAAFFPDAENSPLDPLFADLDGADNLPGTADDDLRLSDESPCINSGDPATVIDPADLELALAPRLSGCRVDIGAYETDFDQSPGDFDDNAVIDLRDIAAFQLCFATPESGFSWSPACLCLFDAQPNDSVDLPDAEAFRQLLTGP